MSADPARRPGEPDDIDSEFERIVAGLDLDLEAPTDSSAATDRSDSTDELPPTSGPLFDPRFSDRMSAQDYEDAREPVDPEDHFEPPDPPAPKLRPLTWLGWLGAVGTPIFMALVALFGWYIPGEFAAFLVAAFVAGVVYLIMSTSRDSGPGDGGNGAVV